MAKTALAPIADRIAAFMIECKVDVSDPYLEEDILEQVRYETDCELDYKPMDMLVGMVRSRLRAEATATTEVIRQFRADAEAREARGRNVQSRTSRT